MNPFVVLGIGLGALLIALYVEKTNEINMEGALVEQMTTYVSENPETAPVVKYCTEKYDQFPRRARIIMMSTCVDDLAEYNGLPDFIED